MAKYRVLDLFYKSKEWISFREQYIATRAIHDGGSRCDYCGQWIDKQNEVTIHHIEELNPDNVSDALTALNPDNMKQLHPGCHNTLHKHAAFKLKRVFIVYGPPMSGKNTYVAQRAWPGDLMVDIDEIYKALAGLPKYNKPDCLYPNAVAVQDLLLDHVKTRKGRWDNAWVIGGYPEKYKREKLAKEIGAEVIPIIISEAECRARLHTDTDRHQRQAEWEGYIAKWYERYTE